MKPKHSLPFLSTVFLTGLFVAGQAHSQATYTWSNSNITATPPANLDWFTGGSNTQGTWTGGDPVSSNLNTIRFFQDNTTQLLNTGNPNTQNVILNHGGNAFELGTLNLSGRASNTANAKLIMNLSGDGFNFSGAAGTIGLDANNVDANRTITYNVANNIELGTASSGSVLTLAGNGTSAFNFSGIISELQAGGGSLVKSGTSTVSLTGANTYTGATFLNAGTLTLSGAGSILSSPITFNGGGLNLINTAAETGSGRVSDSAAITSNGGTLTYTNTSGANVYAETIGSVSLTSGQMNFNLATNQTGAGSQTLTLAGLTRTGATNSSAVTFSAATTGPNATKNRILVSGATQTPAGQIIGSWATTGTAANNQNDYAVYDANGYVVAANIAASAETTWTNATDAYTLDTPAKTATALTATRNIAALKASSTASAASATNGNPAITITGGHSFAVGDPVALSSFSADLRNFNVGRAYYVASVSGSTVTLAETPGGAAITPLATQSLQITGGIKLDDGINLGTTGILNSGNAPLAIGRTAAGGHITLPTAGAGNLHITTGLNPVTSANSGLNGRISIEAPIVDNGGALTLVKNGAGVLRLQGTNTYTGGTVINTGTVIFTDNSNFGSAATPITFNGSGALSFGPNSSWGFASGGTVNLSRPIELNNGAIAGIYYNSPNTTMNISGAITGDGGVISGKDPVVTYGGGDGTIGINFTSTGNNFTGPLTISNVAATFNSLADSSAPMILNAGFTYGSGAIANLSIPSRLIDVRANATITNSAGSTRTMTLGDISTTTTGAKTLTLSNTTANGAGFITGNITNGAGTIAITKTGNGTFTLSGTNTYSGQTSFNGIGVGLILSGSQAASPNTTFLMNSNSSSASSIIKFLDDTGGVNGSSATFGGIYRLQSNNTPGVTNEFFVGNNNTANGGTSSGTTTGSTMIIGTMDWGTVATSTTNVGNINITGDNGYRLQINNVVMFNGAGHTGGTAKNANFNPTTANVTLGNVTQAAGNAVNGVIPTLVLGGTSSDNRITGAISNASDVGTSLRPVNVTKSNLSTWTLSGSNSYTGTTTITTGKLVFSGANSLPTTGTIAVGANGHLSLADGTARNQTVSALTLTSLGSLSFDWTGSGTGDQLTSTADITPTAGSRFAVNLNRSGTPGGPLTLLTGGASSTLSSSTFYLANLTDYTATLSTPTADTLVVDNYAAQTALTTMYWAGNKLAAGTVAGVDNAWALSNGTTSNWSTASGTYAGTALTPGATANVIFSNTLTGRTQQSTVLGSDVTVNSLVIADATAVTVAGANGAALTLMSGLSTAGLVDGTPGSAITVTSTANATSTINSKLSLGSNQTWNVASGKTLAVGGAVSGDFSLTKADAGTVILNGTNTYSGDTTISAGTLRIGNNTAGTLGAGNYAGNIVNNGTLQIWSTAAQTLSGVISGSGNLVKSYTGTLTLSGNNTYTGKTFIQPTNVSGGAGAGILSVSSFNSVNGGTPLMVSSSLGAPTTVENGTIEFGTTTVQQGATLTYTGSGETTDRVINFAMNGNGATKTLDASGTGLLKFTSTFTKSGSDNNDVTLQGAGNGEIVGGLNFALRNFTKTGAGTWTLGANLGHTGTTTISGGTLELNSGATIGGGTYSSTIAFSNSSTLRYNSTANQTLSGVISGAGAIVKENTGTLTLSNTNTYTGATTVNGGTLEVALGGGTAAGSAVTVSNSGSALVVNGTVNGTLVANASTTVSGSGTVVGAATISGNLNPGNSPGELNFTDSLTLTSTTVTTMEINGADLGITYDNIDVGGALSYDGILTLAIGSVFGSNTVFDLFDFGSQSGSFDSVALTGLYTGTFTNSSGVWSTTTNAGNETWSFSQATGDLTLTVIPEPSSVALLGTLGAMLLLRRRR
jgi:fibronectin-binding autotransporter adhesin